MRDARCMWHIDHPMRALGDGSANVSDTLTQHGRGSGGGESVFARCCVQRMRSAAVQHVFRVRWMTGSSGIDRPRPARTVNARNRACP